MHEFEVFRKTGADARDQPVVTLQRRGMISLNSAAFRALDSPVAVELLYNRERRVAGLRAVDQRASNAHLIRRGARTGQAQYVISAAAYVRYYEIDTSTAQRRVAYLDQDTLCVELDGEALPLNPRFAANPRRTDSDSDSDAETG